MAVEARRGHGSVVGDEERRLSKRQHFDDKRDRLAGRQMKRVELL
jgi:hypothetical protein